MKEKMNFNISVEVPVAKDKQDHDGFDVIIPKADHYLAIFTFCLIGTTQLLIWNFVISSFPSFMGYIWPNRPLADLLGGCEHGAALLISIVMLKFDGLSLSLCHLTGVANVALYLIFPLVSQFLAAEVQLRDGIYEVVNGNDNMVAVRGLLSVLSIFLGICSGLLHVQGYAFASITPINYCGYISTGNGVAGVLAFLIFTVLFSLFPRTPTGQIQLLWVFFSLGAACSLVQVACFFVLSKKKWFQNCVKLSSKRRDAQAEKALRQWGRPRSIVEIFKDCWLQGFNAAFTLFVTLLVFPTVGPFHWHQTPDVASYMNGTFQIVDLLVRWMPALGGWTQIPKKYLTTLVIIRPLIFIPLFVLPMRIKNLQFLGDTWWLFILMTIFTITNGWFVTLGSVYCTKDIEHPAEEEIAADIFVIGLLGFITAGIFASKLLIL